MHTYICITLLVLNIQKKFVIAKKENYLFWLVCGSVAKMVAETAEIGENWRKLDNRFLVVIGDIQ